MAIGILIFGLNNLIWKKNTTGLAFFICKNYLNDTVCPLFFLGYCQIVFIWLDREVKSYILIILIGMLAGMIWEYFAPIINPKAISDLKDLLCYFIGINIYWIICKSDEIIAKKKK